MKKNVLIVDEKYKSSLQIPNCEIKSPLEFVLEVPEKVPCRVFNISADVGYQEIGYYASLLAMARNNQVLPEPKVLQDLKDKQITKSINNEIDKLIQTKLKKIKSDQFELSVYMGKNLTEGYDALSWEFFRIVNAPMFRVYLEKKDVWSIRKIKILHFGDLISSHKEFFVHAFSEYISKRVAFKSSTKKYLYDLAILVDKDEASPPSDKKALDAFVDAFKKVGIKAEFIQAKERPNISEYDALFIRETTLVNHHTYKYASKAEKEGLVVIDDTNSILKCTNKIFLDQLMERIGILRPKTMIMDQRLFKKQAKELTLPCILKKPDSAFSVGVHMAKNYDDLVLLANELFKTTELILIQEYLPTEYDWRVGILNGEVLYVCKYYMASGHWQIINNSSGQAEEGAFECLDPAKVDKKVLEVALAATNAIGKGLYGVDLKQAGDKVYMIEVNDNPSIDYGVEDQLLGKDLYLSIAKHFLNECNKRRGFNV